MRIIALRGLTTDGMGLLVFVIWSGVRELYCMIDRNSMVIKISLLYSYANKMNQ